ncbi:MAG: metal-dependent hydrolase [Phycisphaerales bacterium]|nr:metal-dependent hydrolase [Phycisphaerales bacterium]
MPLDITFLGHAGFLLSDGSHTIAIDPFLTDNPVAVHKPADITCDYIALTHGHADHMGDSVRIAKANDATIVAAFEICNYAGSQGVSKVEPGNPGGKIMTPFGFIALTQAFHSSSYDGVYMGMPCGVIVNMAGVTFYHCGDTCLFSDMKLIGEMYGVDVAAIPAGDRFTMGPEQAAKAAEFIKPKVAIPIHWGTWPLLTNDVSGFAPAGVEVKTMQAGDTYRHG